MSAYNLVRLKRKRFDVSHSGTGAPGSLNKCALVTIRRVIRNEEIKQNEQDEDKEADCNDDFCK
jgi:hypothetical protein